MLRHLPLLLPLLFGCGLKLAPSDTGAGAEVEGGTTFGDLSVAPGTVEFGGVDVGDSASQELVLTNLAEGSLVLLGMELSGDPTFTLEGAVSTGYEMAAGEEIVATVRFLPTENASYLGAIDIGIAGLDEPASVPLSGDGLLGGDDGASDGGADDGGGDGGAGCTLTITPSAIDFGEVDLNSAMTESFALANNCANDILVSDIEIPNSDFTVIGISLPQVINSGSNKTVDLVFEPSGLGPVSETMAISTDENGGSRYDIPVTAVGTEPDCYICDPTIEVDTGASSAYEMSFASLFSIPDTKTVTIRNASDVDLRITGYSMTNDTGGGTFTVSGLSANTLTPWTTMSFTVSYKCTLSLCIDVAFAAFDTNILHILSNSTAEPDYAINLSGAGGTGGFAP
jgi:hypothetical protein